MKNGKLVLSAITLILISLLLGNNSCGAEKLSPEQISMELDSGKYYFVMAERIMQEDVANKKDLYQKAIEKFEKVISSDANNAVAHYFLGYSFDRLYNLGDQGTNLLNSTLEQTQKVSELMEKVITLKPDYTEDIHILSPYSKISSSWGSLALVYKHQEKSDSALWAFKQGKEKGGFPEPILEFCRNLLVSAKPNAIIFVNGDNDTFPIWYLQLVENIRNDVTIVNLSLLNTKWYSKFISSAQYFGKPIAMNLSDQDITNIYDRPMEYSQVLQFIIPNLNVNPEIKNEFNNFHTDFKIDIQGRDVQHNSILLIPADYIVLDILKANFWERPTYFSITCNTENINVVGLRNNLSLQGLLFRVFPYSNPNETFLNYEKTNDLVLNKFNYESLNSNLAIFDIDAKNLVPVYIYLFTNLAQNAMEQEKSVEKTRLILEKFDASVDFNKFLNDKNDRSIVADLYKFAGFDEKAIKLLN